MAEDATPNFELGIDDVAGHLARSRRFTVGDSLTKNARVRPDQPAVVDEAGEATTYGELDARVNRLATALQARGVDHGGRVAVLSENRPEYVEVVYAGAKLGTLVAAQNWRLEREEALHCLEVADPDVVFVSGRNREKVEWIEARDGLSPTVVGFDGDGDVDYASLLASGVDEEPEPERQVSPEDGLVVLYTSGTTGLPKGAVISHRAEIARAFVRSSDPEPEVVAWAPMYHMISMDPLISTGLRGGTYHVLDGFDVERILERHRETEATSMQLLPSTVGPVIDYVEEHDLDEETFADIETLGAMADLVAPERIRRITELFDAEFTNSFGSTETGSPPATGNTIEPGVEPDPEELSKSESPLCQVKLVDEDWNEVSRGEVGEVAVRGPTLFSGYLGAPEANESDFRDGWFRMGDLFVRNEDGTLDFVDRRKYLIKSGGENIYPAEVENPLVRHEDVEEAVVVRVPDETWGEVPKAYVATSPDADLDAQDLLAYLDGKVARYKLPHYVEFVDEDAFPRSTSGKVVRPDVEEWPVEESERVREP